jgi:glycine/D-amino acid oxidase-like deaminating enzyme
VGEGIKAGLHHGGAEIDPEAPREAPSEADWEAVETRLRPLMPAAGARLGASPCVYVNTIDSHFIVDTHPSHPALIVASACSGHGFKFAPAIADAVCALVDGSEFHLDMTSFAYDRPGLTECA